MNLTKCCPSTSLVSGFISFLFLVVSYGVAITKWRHTKDRKGTKQFNTTKKKTKPTRVCAIPRNAHILKLRNLCRLDSTAFTSLVPSIRSKFSPPCSCSSQWALDSFRPRPWIVMAMTKYSRCTGDNAESLGDSLMLFGRWLKNCIHKIKQLCNYEMRLSRC